MQIVGDLLLVLFGEVEKKTPDAIQLELIYLQYEITLKYKL